MLNYANGLIAYLIPMGGNIKSQDGRVFDKNLCSTCSHLTIRFNLMILNTLYKI